MEAIDARIKSLLEEIRELKSERNTYALVNRLPSEMLCAIFHFAVGDAPTRECMFISHVCQTWRNLVIKTPAFWTKIDNDCVAAANMFALRADTLPLTITYGEPDDRHERDGGLDDEISNAFSLLERAKEFNVYIPYLDKDTTLSNRVNGRQAPFLEKLSLTCSSIDSELPTPLGFVAPSLKYLSLFDILPDPSSGLLGPHITELDIFISDAYDLSFHSSSWADVLNQLPGLQFFGVRLPLIPGDEEEMVSVPIHPLPVLKLEKLSLSGFTRELHGLYNLLQPSFPPKMFELTLQLKEESLIEEMAEVANILEPWVQSSIKYHQERSLEFIFDSYHIFLNTFAADSLEEILSSDFFSNNLRLVIAKGPYIPITELTGTPGFCALCRLWSPQVVVVGQPPHDEGASEAVVRYITSCPQAETLAFVGNRSSILSFMPILAEIASAANINSWPDLRTIMFGSVKFDDPLDIYEASDYCSCLVQDVELRDCGDIRPEFLDIFRTRITNVTVL